MDIFSRYTEETFRHQRSGQKGLVAQAIRSCINQDGGSYAQQTSESGNGKYGIDVINLKPLQCTFFDKNSFYNGIFYITLIKKQEVKKISQLKNPLFFVQLMPQTKW